MLNSIANFRVYATGKLEGIIKLDNQINNNVNLSLSLSRTINNTANRIDTAVNQVIEGELVYDDDCSTSTIAKKIPYKGQGLTGLKNLSVAISEQLKDITELVCLDNEGGGGSNSNWVYLFPSERFARFKTESQLVLTFGEKYPTTQGSVWHIPIYNPLPADQLSWETHFENITRKHGEYFCRLFYEDTAKKISVYGESQEHLTELITNYLAPLTTEPMETFADGQLRLRHSTTHNVKTKPQSRMTRCVRAVHVTIDPGTNAVLQCVAFSPRR